MGRGVYGAYGGGGRSIISHWFVRMPLVALEVSGGFKLSNPHPSGLASTAVAMQALIGRRVWLNVIIQNIIIS